ncbi:chitin-binding protein [Francisella philomiragia]|uniref:chitin-binding protein n=1 Tax=Francisella philomiragia TaxID=28110 RepID=UPI001C9E01CF|nr:chitin-binding protein [Francisella philomiragia]MBY7735192.1 chitin-binding protein [Francisella philomiragia]
MKKIIVSSILASIALPILSMANTPLKEGQVAYHNTFPISKSATYDLFTTNTEYANTVIMSNTIAGVMYGYLIKQKYPDMKFNKDYLYGSLIGQLMQESDMTTQINTNFEPNNPDQSIQNKTYSDILLSVGQGGPYQINDYSKRLPGVGQKGALGLVNYDSVAKVLGYSIFNQDNEFIYIDGKKLPNPDYQTTLTGPEALVNIYAGPMITAFYHFNDINRMNVNSSNDWYVYHDSWTKCLENSQKSTANGLSFPFVMNVVYNAGDYSPVLKTYLNICANESADSKEYKNMNNWLLDTIEYQTIIGNTVPSDGDATYYRYPRQVSFYINQIFNNNNTKLQNTGIEVNNSVVFKITRLKEVFGMVMHKLSYRDHNEELQYISVIDANTAFDQAIKQLKVTDTELSFSNAPKTANQQRVLLYRIIEKAIANLAKNDSIDFAATYDSSEPEPQPGPTPEPQYTYPNGIGDYVAGTVVSAGDSTYKCIYPSWCNSTAYSPLGPNSDSAWQNLNPQPTPPTPEGDWDPSKIYVENDVVRVDSIDYKAKYWNKDQDPRENNCDYGCPWTKI